MRERRKGAKRQTREKAKITPKNVGVVHSSPSAVRPAVCRVLPESQKGRRARQGDFSMGHMASKHLRANGHHRPTPPTHRHALAESSRGRSTPAADRHPRRDPGGQQTRTGLCFRHHMKSGGSPSNRLSSTCNHPERRDSERTALSASRRAS